MTDFSKLFDAYSLRARLYPALLTLLPPILLALTWRPGLKEPGEMVVGVGVACGALYLFADIARSRGKALEKSLLKEWGGWPTTIMLRRRDIALSAVLKKRYHEILGGHVGRLPTLAQEDSDPRASDEIYDGAVAWLKEHCRTPDYGLVLTENINYGFRRNLRGLKIPALLVYFSTIAAPGVISTVSARQMSAHALVIGISTLPPLADAVLVLTIIASIAWVFGVTKLWVRQAGDQYAKALLACCDRLPVK